MARDERKHGFSRRDFVKGAMAGAAVSAGGPLLGSAAQAAVCDGSRDLILTNGRFLTMNAGNTVATAVGIRNGRIVQVGNINAAEIGSCVQTIDLRGATVIPGLCDSHLHFIRDGLNPGHEVRIIETATSIAELQQMIVQRALTVPLGEFITCVGGWNRNGLGENPARLPTLVELNIAAPNHPLFLSETGGGGQAVTNSLGMAFFQSKGVAVNATTGVLSAASGFIALRNAEIAGEPAVSTREKGTVEAIDFISSLGMTGVHDVGGNGGFAGNTSLFVDLKPYEQAMALWRAGNLKTRLRLFLYSDTDPDFIMAHDRILSNFKRVGDDYFRLLGVGERVNVSTTDPRFVDHCKFAAQNAWTVQQHSSTQAEIALHLSAFQQANALAPIRPFRWSLTHVNSITPAQVQAMIDLGTGLTVQGTAYTSGTLTGGSGGTPFRTILDMMGPAGIAVGGGSDATNVGALNPWLMMYFMFTGRNNAGVVINAGGAQNSTRLEALRMYTIGSAYFGFDDSQLGSIEVGKLADLAVLSDDPLTVSEGAFRKLRSTMTVLGGKIVSGAPPA